MFLGALEKTTAVMVVLALFAPLQGERREPVVQARSVWKEASVPPGGKAILAVVLEIAPNFHINPDSRQLRVLGDFSPYASELKVVVAPASLIAETPVYPEPHPLRVDFAEGEILVWSGNTVIYVPFAVGADAAGGPAEIELDLRYQACDDKICLPPVTLKIKNSFNVRAKGDPDDTRALPDSGLFHEFEKRRGNAGSKVGFDFFEWKFSVESSGFAGVLAMLALASLGGLLLNFTPCVLPVIPLKIISLAEAGGQKTFRVFALGIAMSTGITAFWLVLGIAVAAASGAASTHQIFTRPVFSIATGLVIILMGAGMGGFFNIPLPEWAGRYAPRSGSISGSLGLGIMTGVLATPCTAPFMGAAAAWAILRGPAHTLLAFTAIGAGMAVPYLVLSMNPAWARKLPRAGPGSVLLKQLMGLLLAAAGSYFVGAGVSAMLSTSPDPPSQGYWWVVMGFVAAAGVWLARGSLHSASRPATRGTFVLLGLGGVFAALYGGLRLTDPGPIPWVPYTPERFSAALRQGKVVVAEFTAEWCLNCKALEKNILQRPEVAADLSDAEVVPLKVDLTAGWPPARDFLRSSGRWTIPWLVIYAPDGRAVFASDTYTPGQVQDALRQARALPARR